MLDDWREWSAKPGRLTGRHATVALAVADLFLAFGLLLGAVAFTELPSGEPILRLALGGFLVAWVAFCAAIIVKLTRPRRAELGRRAAGD